MLRVEVCEAVHEVDLLEGIVDVLVVWFGGRIMAALLAFHVLRTAWVNGKQAQHTMLHRHSRTDRERHP